VQPTTEQRAQWAAHGLVPGELYAGVTADGIHIAIQQLLPTYASPNSERWEAWWYDGQSHTAGTLHTVNPMPSAEFARIAKREALRRRSIGMSANHDLDGFEDYSATGVYTTEQKVPFTDEYAEPDLTQAEAAPPVDTWEPVHTTPADHERAKSRIKRNVRCRHCGAITGSLSRTCGKAACIVKTAQGLHGATPQKPRKPW
jgi:hypothetical protein